MAHTTHTITSTPYGRLLSIVEGVNTYNLSDHNRAPLDVSYERISKDRRTANGTRRRYFVADKRQFSVSWTMLPNSSATTVDVGIGAEELESLWFDTNNVGAVDLNIEKRDGSTETVSVHITDFNASLNKRYGDAHYYDVSMEFEEI